MELTYVINSRMPTEEAHGLQTVRMCEAFEELGHDVTLLHADRRQPTAELRDTSVLEFYDVTEPLTVGRIPYFNGFRMASKVGWAAAKPFILFGNLSFAATAALAVKRTGGDYVITREWQVAVALVLLGIPTIFSAHTVEALGFSSRARRAFGAVSGRDALRLVVTNSRGTAEGMADIGVPEEKILPLPNGVDLENYADDVDRAIARRRVGLPVEDRLVVYTGTLVEQKGAYVLADASELIYGTVVLVGGEPEEVEEMETYVQERDLDDVIVVGYVNPRDIPDYQFAADVLALPPLAGNYDRRHQAEYTSPLKLFEYMAAGRPIVASDIPALHEVLTDGESALFVEPGDPASFAEAVSRLADDESLRDRLATRASEAAKQYSWRGRAEQVLQALERDDRQPE